MAAKIIIQNSDKEDPDGGDSTWRKEGRRAGGYFILCSYVSGVKTTAVFFV